MKLILATFALLFSLTALPLHADGHVSKSGDIKIADLGKWKVKNDAVDQKGNANLSLTRPGQSIFVDIKCLRLAQQFDVMMPAFTTQIKTKLKESGMKIVASGETVLFGNKAFQVFAIKPLPGKDKEPMITYVISYSSFAGPEQFITISIAHDEQDPGANPDVQHLLKNLSIVPKK